MAKKRTPVKKKKLVSKAGRAKKDSATKAVVKKAAKKKNTTKPLPAKRRQRLLTLTQAKAFVKSVRIPKAPVRFKLGGEKEVPFTEGIDQSLVVGSDIVSFASSLKTEQRKMVVNSLLLAQLAATAKVKDQKNIKGWYGAYFETLGKIGWLIQDTGFTEYKSDGSHMEVNKAIIKVASVVFGPAVTALAVVTATLNGLSEMSENAPWLTIFKRSSETSRVSRFQVTTAEATKNGTMVYTMAFELKTKNKLTQVLFFKLSTAEVSFSHASGKVTLDDTRSSELAPAIAQKVSAHLLNNIEEIEI